MSKALYYAKVSLMVSACLAWLATQQRLSKPWYILCSFYHAPNIRDSPQDSYGYFRLSLTILVQYRCFYLPQDVYCEGE
jgi:hypothetical protein